MLDILPEIKLCFTYMTFQELAFLSFQTAGFHSNYRILLCDLFLDSYCNKMTLWYGILCKGASLK